MSYDDEVWHNKCRPHVFISQRMWEEKEFDTAMAKNDWRRIDRLLMQKDINRLPRVIKAMKHGYFKLTRWMVLNGEDVNSVDMDNCTALHRAAVRQEVDKIQFLLTLNPDVNKLDLWEETPLMKACIGAPNSTKRAIVEMLLKAGANPYILGTNGRTVLTYEAWPTDLTPAKFVTTQSINVIQMPPQRYRK